MQKTDKERVCVRCDKSHFYNTSLCPSCQVVLSRKNQKLKAIQFLGGECALCGYNKCPAALEFHHLDPSQKEFNIGQSGATRSWQLVQQELLKCILLCANCHREVEAQVTIIPQEVLDIFS